MMDDSSVVVLASGVRSVCEYVAGRGSVMVTSTAAARGSKSSSSS